MQLTILTCFYGQPGYSKMNLYHIERNRHFCHHFQVNSICLMFPTVSGGRSAKRFMCYCIIAFMVPTAVVGCLAALDCCNIGRSLIHDWNRWLAYIIQILTRSWEVRGLGLVAYERNEYTLSNFKQLFGPILKKMLLIKKKYNSLK